MDEVHKSLGSSEGYGVELRVGVDRHGTRTETGVQQNVWNRRGTSTVHSTSVHLVNRVTVNEGKVRQLV